MAPLENAKHEAFARALVDGKSARAAYRGAGFTPKTDASADAAASRLLSDVKVAARVAELKGQVAQATVNAKVMDITEVLEELSKLGRSSIINAIVAGDDTGEVVKSIRDLPPEHAAAIQELTVETYVEGGGENARDVKRVKVKLHDKRGALAELRRHHEPNKHEHSGRGGGPIELEDKTERPSDFEVARRILFVLESAARTKAKPPAKASGKRKGTK